MAPKSSTFLHDLPEKVATIFDQAQTSVASHRKNCVALYKLHVQAGSVTEVVKNGKATKLVGERAFGDAFIDMITRVLVIKKGPAAADRVVRFIGTYVKFMNEKVMDEKTKKAKASESASALAAIDDDDDNLASRFVSRLLKWLMQGFLAKNKIVRYRTVFIASELISHLGEIDEDTYNLLRESLMDRINDKESLIRTYAVIALSKLIGTEDPSEIVDGQLTTLETLLETMSLDDAAEVRRAALVNVPLDNATLGPVLSRTRDTDPVTRKLVYSLLESKLVHPRQLSIALREQLVKDGLGDREPAVRLAAGKLIASWFDKILGEAMASEGGTWKGDDAGVMKAFIAFLGLFDVVGPGEIIAIDAMLSIFITRPELIDVFEFPGAYWTELTPESVVLARAFVEHCDSQTRLEAAAFPVVTAFAFYIQEAYNTLLEVLEQENNVAEDEEEAEDRSEEIAKREVILGELLRMAVKLDYMDEIGRRKVFSVVKDILSHPDLPSGLIERCLDILKAILPDERELIRIAVEIIIELRENVLQAPEGDDETAANDDSRSDAGRDRSLRHRKEYRDMTMEERAIADVIDLRCLIICIALLERVHGSFEDNSTLEGILADLIIPSVKRREPALREKGLISLGLCCLIAKNMALSSFQLFLNQVQSVPEDMKMRVLQVIFDLLIMYPREFFGRSEDIAKRITAFLLDVFQSDVSDTIRATMAIGFSKLLLAGNITDASVLAALALSYVNFETRENQELRQCLSYFFPVYCYSSWENQNRMQSVFMDTYDLFVKLHEESDPSECMISPYQFGLLMLDWTNSQKAASINGTSIPCNVHADLAVDILRALYVDERSANDRKVLCQLLGNLDIAIPVDDRTLYKLHLLLSNLQQQCPFNDASLDRTFGRFKDRIYKLFRARLEDMDATHFLDEEFSELYDYIGIGAPNALGAAAAAKKRTPETERSLSVDAEAPGLGHENDSIPPEVISRSPLPHKNHKADVEESAAEDSVAAPDESSDEANSVTHEDGRSSEQPREVKSRPRPSGPRTVPPTTALSRARAPPHAEDGSENDDIDSDGDGTGPSNKKGVKRNRTTVPSVLKSPRKKRTRVQKSEKSSNSAKAVGRKARAKPVGEDSSSSDD